MKPRFARSAAPLNRSRRASTLGFLLTLLATGSAAAQGTSEQRKAGMPDVYRLCAGEIPHAPRHHSLPAPAEGEFEPGCASMFER